jgi:hypothetical protein
LSSRSCKRSVDPGSPVTRKTPSYPFPQFRSVERSTYRGVDLDETLVALATCSGDRESVRRLSLVLADSLLNRRAKRRQGETHLVSRHRALSDTAIATMAVNMLAGCLFSKAPPPPELVRLFVVLHNLEVPANDEKHDLWKVPAAINYIARHPEASIRQVARLVSVSPNTLRAWMKDLDFTSDVERIRGLLMHGIKIAPIWYPPDAKD